MQTRTEAIACFGKVPTHGDFLRVRSDGDLARAFDEWMQQGLYAMKTRAGDRFQSTYDSGRPFGFCFQNADAERMLVGVLRPSRDRVGRRYPLVIARESDTSTRTDLTRLPVNHAAFLVAAHELAARVADGEVDYRDLEGCLDKVADMDALQRADIELFDKYLNEKTLKSLVVDTWGYFEDTRKYLVFRNMLDAAQEFGGSGSDGAASGLKLPLSTKTGFDGFEPSYWLAVCERILHPTWERACYLWSFQSEGDGPGALLLFGGPPTASGFIALFSGHDGPSGPGQVVDVQEVGKDHAVAAVLSLPAHYGEVLEADDLSLQEVLRRLQVHQARDS